jgi:hypothetical protein
MAILHNAWPFGVVCGHLVYFSRFGMFGPGKIWQPWRRNPFHGLQTKGIGVA